MLEIWREIRNYPRYEVSNQGRIRSLNFKEPKILKGWINQNRRYVHISNENGNKHIQIAKLVLLHYKNEEIGKEYALHLNGITIDDKVENLEWATFGDVLRHTYEQRKQIRGAYEVKIGKYRYWAAKLKVDNKLKTIGYYTTKVEAIFAFFDEYVKVYKRKPW